MMPINRPINGVIKAEQLDDDSVWQELDEFVVTKELDEHLRKFLDAYLSAIDNPNDPSVASKVGVWVSGFFGSGKSHFIKILSYLLENKKVTKEGLTKSAIEFFEGKIQDPLLAGDIKRAVKADVDVILFNIDTKADNADGRDVILRVFLKVFNERLGFSGDHPHIAHMERHLVKKKKYEAFQKEFEAHAGESWHDVRDAYSFHSAALAAALSKVLDENIKDADTWLERFKGDFSLSIESFAKWVKEYLDTKGKNHRIMFLVDEIGQFIGKETPLMLNLQTITENLGTVCNGRAWVVVTSQEDMDAALGNMTPSSANDFSKIQGRFKTRLSLSGANADEVIQKRLLSKVDTAKPELEKLYAEKSDILKNQLSFKNLGMSVRPYANADDFVAFYPFAPFHFPLVQKIFESTRKSGATGAHLAKGERSMLDAFQSAITTKNDTTHIYNEDIGVLVPLYCFYPAIESFLEGVVRRAIKSVDERPGLEPFDGLVLKTLFLIRYVDEIKGNVDNLVTLFIDRIDADRLALRNQIEASLQRLEKETLVSRNGEEFFFLTNEERDISREIKDIELSQSEENKLLGKLVFEDVLNEQSKYRYPRNKKDFSLTRLCDLHPFGTRTDGSLVLSVITPLADDYPMFNEAKCINQSTMNDGQLVIRLDDDKTLASEISAYLRTEKYISKKDDGTVPPSTKKILNERREENRQRKNRLVEIIRKLMLVGKYYVAGQKPDLAISSIPTGIDEALNYLVENAYRKLDLLKHPTSDHHKEIRSVLASANEDTLGLQGDLPNSEALKEVNNYVSLMGERNHRVVLYNLAFDHFGHRPYGWQEWETILLVVRLVMLGEISLSSGGSTLTPDKIYGAIDGTSKWRNVTVMKRKTVDKASLQSARTLARDVFDAIAPDGEDGLAAHIRQHLEQWQTDLSAWKSLADTDKYPGSADIADALGVIARAQAIKDNYQYIEHFIERKDDLLELSETIAELDTFYTSQKTTWEKLRQSYDNFKNNALQLVKDNAAATALKQIDDILHAKAPYGMIKDANALIAKVKTVNDRLIKERQDHALTLIDGHIAKVKDELDLADASAEIRNKCLHPLQSIRTQVQNQTSIAHIYQLQQEAREEADEAIDKASQQTPAPDQTPGVSENGQPFAGAKPQVPSKPPKKRRIIQPTELVATPYLETQDDVDGFLDELRDKLESAINNNERVEIR